MKILRKIGKVFSHLVDFRVDRWLDLKGNRESALYFVGLARRMLVTQKSHNPQTFDEVVESQALSENSLKKRSLYYKRLAWLFCSFTILIFTYAVYLWKQSNLTGATMCLALTVYPLSVAFRYHFWHFQIERKKLGCSLKEWFIFLRGTRL